MNESILPGIHNMNNSISGEIIVPWFDFDLLHTYSWLYDIMRYAQVVWAYGIAPVGFVGSVLTLLVLQHSKMSGSAFSFHLPMIALFDGLKLIVQSLFVFADDFHFKTKWFCKFAYFFGNLFAFVSFFLVVAVSIDRTIAITWPHKAKVLSTVNKAKITTLCVFVML